MEQKRSISRSELLILSENNLNGAAFFEQRRTVFFFEDLIQMVRIKSFMFNQGGGNPTHFS